MHGVGPNSPTSWLGRLVNLVRGDWTLFQHTHADASQGGTVASSGIADALNSATTVVDVSAATAPTNGQVLRATSGTAATWQTIAGGGDALVANPLSQFAATTSAQLAGVLSDETGTGAAVFANGPTLIAPVLGTPASGVATNLTGTAAGLTAGAVTTNANLTGPVTSVGNATTIADAELAAIAGLTSAANKGITFTGSGTAATFDLTAAALTVLDDATVSAMVDTLGGASATGTGGLVRATSPTLVTPALGTPASGVATNLTGTAASLTAGSVTTNANLTGPVTSVGNATTIADAELAALAGLTSAADKLPYFTGSGTAALADFTAVARTLVAAATAALQRSALGLGDLATKTSPFEAGRLVQIFKAPATTTLFAVGCDYPSEDASGVAGITSEDSDLLAVQRYPTGTTSGDSAGATGSAVARIGQNGDFLWRFKTGASVVSVRLWVGLTNTTLGAIATPTTEHVAAISYDSTRDGTAFWRMVTCNGTSATVTASTIAIAAGGDYTVRIVTAASSAAFYVNGALAGTLTTTLPGSSIDLKPEWRVTTLTAAGKRIDFSRFGAMIP